MFDNLSQRLQRTVKQLRGQARLSDENMTQTLREVRMALLEADVALPVVKAFVETIREQAKGEEVLKSLTPGQALIKIVHDELVHLMGDANDALDLAVRPPAIILLAGLQGVGKTTTVAKLARYLQEREKKSVMVVSVDIYRPAAIKQLETLAGQVGVDFYASTPGQSPVEIARNALQAARQQAKEVLIVDTAGRLHIDAEMMSEIKEIHEQMEPVETLFVADSMTGQDAVNTAKAFDEALSLTGVILTKADGDARGGAALSIREVTGKPIKFLGVGEQVDALEPFYPDRVASRILGMGDVLTLVEEAEREFDQEKARKIAHKLKKGKGFDLEDFRDQLLQMEKMGGLTNIMDKLPGMNEVPEAARDQLNGKQTRRLVAIINSMTSRERQSPDIIRGSRKRRIANGSGTEVQEVNRLLKQFTQMQKMMKRFKKGGMQKMLRGLPGMPFK